MLRAIDNVVTLPPPARYPDTLAVAVGRNVRADVQRAARIAGVSMADFLRTAIDEHVRRTLNASGQCHG